MLHATALGLSGFVRNDSAGVLIEVEGSADAVGRFTRDLLISAPPQARIEAVETAMVATLGETQNWRVSPTS